MANQTVNCEKGIKDLVVAITDFLGNQRIRSDLRPEDGNRLSVAIEELLKVYDVEGSRYVTYRGFRPLLDVFRQVTNPVRVIDKIRADCYKERGNNYMKRSMFGNAETEYTKAIELDKWNAIYYANRASAKIKQGKNFGAIPDCRQALMINPDYAKAYARLGEAYTLLHRPSDAAGCYGKALDLEPENERYRNNLRVAQNEIDRPPNDAAQMINNLLSFSFRIGIQSEGSGNHAMIPTSLTIFTENHPLSTPETLTQSAGSSGISQITPVTKDGNNYSTATTNNINKKTSLRYFGVIDEGAEEQVNEYPEEFVINIPLSGFGDTTLMQSSSILPESRIKNTKTEDGRPAESVQNNVPDKETLAKHESKVEPNGLDVNAHVILSGSKENIIEQDAVFYDETCFSYKQNDTQSETRQTEASTSYVTGKNTDAEKKVSTITAIYERLSKTGKYTNGNANEDEKRQNGIASEKHKKRNAQNDAKLGGLQ